MNRYQVDYINDNGDLCQWEGSAESEADAIDYAASEASSFAYDIDVRRLT